MSNFADAFALVLDPQVLIVCVLAGLLGLIVGSLPGLTATLGAALLIPFTFFLDPVPAVASIITMSAMALFAGDIPGALLRMPGTPSSVAYVSILYRFTQDGRSVLGLTISLISSVTGGLVGAAVLIFVAPVVGELAFNFTSYEYFWMAVLGLTAAVIVSRGSQVKGAIALMTGLLLSTVGMDVALGFPRFTFGEVSLYQGIGFIPAMIGLFGVSEVLRNVSARQPPSVHIPKNISGKGSTKGAFGVVWRHKGKLAQGNATGSVVGALPGAGADIAAWISYAISKATGKSSAEKKPRKKKDEPELPEGTDSLVAASGANNAAVSSAYVPTLAFGIPGDTITAILIGVLLVKGIQPGPSLFTTQTDTLYAIYIIFIIANLLLIPLGLLAIRFSGLIMSIPRPALIATIVGLSITGAYAMNHAYVEVWIVLVLALVGFAFERYGVPLAPVVLGVVLGPIVEANFMRSVIATNWDLMQFFTRPVSAALIVCTALLLLYPVIASSVRKMLQRRNHPTPTSKEVL